MPVMDGLNATLYLKNTEKYKSRPIPILAVTANAFNEDRDKAFAAGMDDFITKPIRPAELEYILLKFNVSPISC